MLALSMRLLWALITMNRSVPVFAPLMDNALAT